MEEQVVLVDSRDNEVGTAPKLQAHQEARLHRAISVFLFNDAGELLLQRRAAGKYHSPGLWSNACCTHPRPGEKPHRAALRRLEEEMGMQTPLDYRFSFLYKAQLAEDLWEHELDHVFVGTTGETPVPDPEEVQDWRWVSLPDLDREMAMDPGRFSVWFPIALEKLREREETGAR